MTKPFCDMCGAPASSPRVHTHLIPDQRWSGPKLEKGSVGMTDGTWTPSFTVWAMFQAENLSKENASVRNPPDLCRDCMVKLLTELLTKIKTNT